MPYAPHETFEEEAERYKQAARASGNAVTHLGSEIAKLRADSEALADAMGQLLDDMGADGQSVCLYAKAKARIAYEPFCDHADWEPGMSLERAQRIVNRIDGIQ